MHSYYVLSLDYFVLQTLAVSFRRNKQSFFNTDETHGQKPSGAIKTIRPMKTICFQHTRPDWVAFRLGSRGKLGTNTVAA
jgi:hypothetical protein